MIPADIWFEWVMRLFGAGFGSAMALVFWPPRSRNGFFRRTAAGLGCGLMFGHEVQVRLSFINGNEGLMAGAAFAAFVSWFAMGAIVRVVRGWTK